ncbi:MAG TPA: ABC transporter ATP-binding protein [Dehalococcoidia bacterium]|nr:ABC transporter ATP-binding protein [Dehalococcoidia bacterium]
MLEVEDLTVEVEGREVIHDISLNVDVGETLALFGPNGSGKTTLLMAIMGFPRYKVTRGRILFNGEDITHLPVDERSRMGIGILFQRPPVVRGVKMRDMVRACLGSREDGAVIEQLAEQANMVELLDRDVNYGFSGGEIKRSELLQLIAQSPEFVLLDEPDSGVDLVNISLVGEMINELLQKNRMRSRTSSGLIITHTGHILDYVNADRACVLLNGGIWCRGNPQEILTSIKSHGYEGCAVCQK